LGKRGIEDRALLRLSAGLGKAVAKPGGCFVVPQLPRRRGAYRLDRLGLLPVSQRGKTLKTGYGAVGKVIEYRGEAVRQSREYQCQQARS
jgi:hypothetical protein